MQEVKIQNLVLNVLTQEQFKGAEKDASQLYLTPDDTDEKLAAKQDKLIAGNNITIEGNVISAVGGSGSGDTIGLSIGDVVFSYSSLSSENPGKLPLFTGETIASANTIYPDFYNWILAHTELQCTSAEYEASLTTYGECAKYVIGGGSLRLPLIKNYIKAANPSEGIKNIEAGLPNITGSFSVVGENYAAAVTGAFVIGGMTSNSAYDGNAPRGIINFDASNSSTVYGSSNTVTPPSTTLYPWVVAYAAAIPASTAQAAQFQAALSGKVDVPSGKTQADVDFVVESYHGEDGNWYRKYKSGWVEQGGISATVRATAQQHFTVTLLKPMLSNNYSVMGNYCFVSGQSSSLVTTKITNESTISFTAEQANNTGAREGFIRWSVLGQGAN